jgi:O-antigen/teichoic acid export membrane protein
MSDEIEPDQLAMAHRQSGMMLIFTLALIAFLLFVTADSIVGGIALIFLLISLPICVLIVRAYFQRRNWALPWVTTIWMIAIALCFFLMIVEFIGASEGNAGTWGYVQGLLLLYLCWSMLQRLRLFRHPMFRSWYDGTTPALNQNISLQSDEVLASCPHCHSLLAVQPLNLGVDELCPKCNMKLVLTNSVELYSEEE